MFLGVYNLIEDATLSAGSWTTLDNLKSDKLYSIARSTDATTASTQFQVDLGSAKSVYCMSLHAHNLSSAATITLKAGTSAGASDVLNSTGNNAYSVTFDDTRLFSTHYDVIILAGVEARYWTIEVTDTGNTNGYIDIGRAGLWQGLEPTYNMSYGVQYGINDDISRTERSLAGDFLYSQEPRKRTANFALGLLTDSEGDQAHELLRVIGITKEVLFYVADQKYNMLGRLGRVSPLNKKVYNINTVEFEVIER